MNIDLRRSEAEPAADKAPRAPRLTTLLLYEDLPELLKSGEDDLEYARGALESHLTHKVLGPRFKAKIAHLERSTAWLRGMIAAEKYHRTKANSEGRNDEG